MHIYYIVYTMLWECPIWIKIFGTPLERWPQVLQVYLGIVKQVIYRDASKISPLSSIYTSWMNGWMVFWSMACHPNHLNITSSLVHSSLTAYFKSLFFIALLSYTSSELFSYCLNCRAETARLYWLYCMKLSH